MPTSSPIDIDRLRAAQLHLDAMGPRLTGTESHRMLVEEVAAELTDLGLEVRRDTQTFERWDLPSSADGLRIDLADGSAAVSSAFPYSGITGPAGISAPLILLNTKRPRWSRAKGAIAVIEVPHIDLPRKLLVSEWGPIATDETLRNPVLSATLLGPKLEKARAAGVLGVIAVWRDIAPDNALGQYLPFTEPYHDIPAVWVAGDEATKVLAASRAGQKATLVLDATLHPGTTTDTVWVVSPGTSPHETILVITHSDGTNGVEENGHLGMLELARHAVAHPHRRSYVFVLTTGHLRIPAVSKHGQATSTWLEAHPEMWKGEAGQARAVAGIAIEHLGAIGDAEDNASGSYALATTPEPELLYATSLDVHDIVAPLWRDIGAGDRRIVAPGPVIHFGEGEPLFERNIPTVALVTAPQYLLALREASAVTHVDIDALTKQVENFRALLDAFDATETAAFGTVVNRSVFAKFSALLQLMQILSKAKK
ncbi:hypothetical protein [Rhodococcus sp. IEGM 1379]|uniref:hypothetical protein n=1 Tax=Rhodococcus sp. IEGM 1379 TaxID=3047086 RepID=UPI0024B7AFD2|nr:hypothetical protein [Rhodococcus sp. IEGM 1379]MDI9916410.1 hypothetical protein [Rhodococcus sp. IEGM 1379]